MTITPAPEHGKRKSKAQRAKLAQLLANDTPVGAALIAAGWSETQAMKGWGAVPDAVYQKLPKEAKRLMALGKIHKDARRDLVRGRLVSNTISGRDGGAQSAKILGSDTELNMWQPELNQGVIILQAPREALEHKAELLGEEVSSAVPES